MPVAKEQELLSLKRSFHTLRSKRGTLHVDIAEQMKSVDKQLRDIQAKHMEVISKTKSVDKISGESINRLYTEIGITVYIW